MMVRRLSFWDGIFKGAMLNFRWVQLLKHQKSGWKTSHISHIRYPCDSVFLLSQSLENHSKNAARDVFIQRILLLEEPTNLANQGENPVFDSNLDLTPANQYHGENRGL